MRCFASSRGNLLLGLGLLVTTSTANVDLSIYPDVYQAVLNDTTNTGVLATESAITAFDKIKNTVTNELNYTRACIKSLTVAQATECYKAGQSFIEEGSRSWTNEEFLAQARFRNLFAPDYIDKTLGMMLFDTSFKYFGKYGFHQNAQLLIKNCALSRCKDQKDEIIKELTTVNSKYNNDISTHMAGYHYKMSWSKMIEQYNKNGGAPGDSYNLWMPALEAGENWHSLDFNTTEIALGDKERHTWYTAMRFAVVHHFHHYYLFGADGLFTMGFQTSESELLNEAEKQFKDSSLMEEEFLQKFAQFQGRSSFDHNRLRTLEDFQKRIHSEGQKYMMDRSKVYFTFITRLSTPSTFSKKSLLSELGYRETPELIKKLKTMRTSLKSLKYQLFWLELEASGQKAHYIIFTFIPNYIIIPFLLLLGIFKFVILLYHCCCCCKNKVKSKTGNKKSRTSPVDSLDDLAQRLSNGGTLNFESELKR